MARKMWMGPRTRERWVPAPATGMETDPTGWSSKQQFLNGGAGMRSSSATHQEYQVTWNPSARDSLRPIVDMARSMHGSGPLYFIDPMASDKNALPYQWSVPSLAALDGPVLWGNQRPGTLPTELNDNDYPYDSAQYTAVAGPMRYQYSWSGTTDNSTSIEKLDGQVNRTNYVQNPSAEGSTPSLQNQQSTAITMVPDSVTGTGAKSYQITTTGVGNVSANLTAANRAPVTAGQQWWARFNTRLISGYGARQLSCYLRFYDASGNDAGTTRQDVNLTPAGTFHRWTGTAGASTSEEYSGTNKRVNLANNPRATTSTNWANAGYGTNGVGTQTFSATSGPYGDGASTVIWTTRPTAGGHSTLHNLAGQSFASGDVVTVTATVLTDIAQQIGIGLIGSPGVITATTTAGVPLVVSRTFSLTAAITSPNAEFRLLNAAGVGSFTVTHVLIERAASAAPYFDGDTVTPVQGKYRAWTGAANASTSIENAPDGSQRTNLARYPRPTSTMTGWSTRAASGNSVTSTYNASGGPDGGSFSRLALTAVGGSWWRQTTSPIPITPNATYSASIWFRPSIAQDVQFTLRNNEAQTERNIIVTAASVTPGQWQSVSYTLTTSAAQATLIWDLGGTGTGANSVGDYIDVSMVTIEQASTVGAYFDGSTIDPSLVLPTGQVTNIQALAISGIAPTNATTVGILWARQALGTSNALAPSGDVYGVDQLLLTQDPSTTTPTYFDGNTTANTRANSTPPSYRKSVYIPIPPGHTAWVGWHGQSDGTGGLEVTPVISDTSTAAPVAINALPVSSTRRVSDAFSGDLYRGIDVRFGGGNATVATIAGAMVQILPSTATPQDGGFISGQGHSGCKFDNMPKIQAYSAAVGTDGLAGLSGTLVEYGDWV